MSVFLLQFLEYRFDQARSSIPLKVPKDEPMTQTTRDLTDAQWGILDGLIPEPLRRPDGRGRPWKDRRPVLNGILWVLRTGAPWSDLPERYPSYQTCHRRFQQWVRSGIMRGALEALAEDLQVRGRLDVRESFIDGSFAPARKGAEGRQDQARQRNEDHGCRRQPWSANCRVRRKRYTS